MGSLIGTCAGSCCAGLACGAAKISVSKRGPLSRLPYLFLLVLSGVFAAILSLYGEEHWNIGNIKEVRLTPAGNSSVFRISMVLCIFEALHFFGVWIGPYALHYYLFGLKFILFIGAAIGVLFIKDESVFSGYADASRYFLSPIYLLIQIILLITWIYDINDAILEKAKESTSNFLYWVVFLTSVALYVTCYVIQGYFFSWYSQGDCPSHDTVISLVIIIVTFNLFAAIFAGVKQRAPFKLILPSALISCYSTYLVYSGLQASDVDECNQFVKKRSTAVLWIGIIISLLGLAYAALRSNLPSIFMETTEDESEPLANEREEDDIEMESHQREDGQLESESEKSDVVLTVSDKKDAVCFHFIMMLAAAYMAMLLTSWSTNRSNRNVAGKAALWANFACLLLNQFLYFWTLLAPLVCPQRFQTETDQF